MPPIKLARLPDRTPVKLTISVAPTLADDLAAYATLYRETYGRDEAVVDLVPAMLAAYLESDRSFVQARRRPAGAPQVPAG